MMENDRNEKQEIKVRLIIFSTSGLDALNDGVYHSSCPCQPIDLCSNAQAKGVDVVFKIPNLDITLSQAASKDPNILA